MIDFPASPTVGQAFVDPATGLQWVWDGTKWKASGLATPPLPVPMNDNRLINGDMRVDQRNNGAAGTAGGYTVDRWQYGTNVAGHFVWQRVAGPASSGFPYCLLLTSQAAYAPAASDGFAVYQAIEADMVSDLAWGTANAQPVTLSFWVFSSLAGLFSGCVRNFAATRSYPFSFNLSASSWTKVAITIPGDTVGTWVMSGNAASVTVLFDLGSGSTLRGPAGAWAGTTYNGVTGAVSVVGTLNGQFAVTGVKLEIGSVTTPFNRQSLAKSMADCQRYYQNTTMACRSNAPAAGAIYCSSVAFACMRAIPTITATGAGSPSNISQAIPAADSPQSGYFTIVSAAAGDAYALDYGYALSAEL